MHKLQQWSFPGSNPSFNGFLQPWNHEPLSLQDKASISCYRRFLWIKLDKLHSLQIQTAGVTVYQGKKETANPQILWTSAPPLRWPLIN